VLDKIAVLEEKLPRLLEALEKARAENQRLRERGAGKAAATSGRKGKGAASHAEEEDLAALQDQVASLEGSLKRAEAATADLRKKLETERAARSKAESSLTEALKRLDHVAERLEGVDSDLAALEG